MHKRWPYPSSILAARECYHRSRLLRKVYVCSGRDGRFYLVLWQEVSSYDLEAKTDISVVNRKVTLNRSISKAVIYRPNRSVTPPEQHSSPRRLTLEVPDELLVVELTTSKGGDLRK
jgi:hypothetical protein